MPHLTPFGLSAAAGHDPTEFKDPATGTGSPTSTSGSGQPGVTPPGGDDGPNVRSQPFVGDTDISPFTGNVRRWDGREWVDTGVPEFQAETGPAGTRVSSQPFVGDTDISPFTGNVRQWDGTKWVDTGVPKFKAPSTAGGPSTAGQTSVQTFQGPQGFGRYQFNPSTGTFSTFLGPSVDPSTLTQDEPAAPGTSFQVFSGSQGFGRYLVDDQTGQEIRFLGASTAPKLGGTTSTRTGGVSAPPRDFLAEIGAKSAGEIAQIQARGQEDFRSTQTNIRDLTQLQALTDLGVAGVPRTNISEIGPNKLLLEQLGITGDLQLQGAQFAENALDRQLQAAGILPDLLNSPAPLQDIVNFLNQGGGNIQNAIAAGGSALTDANLSPAALALQSLFGGGPQTGGPLPVFDPSQFTPLPGNQALDQILEGVQTGDGTFDATPVDPQETFRKEQQAIMARRAQRGQAAVAAQPAGRNQVTTRGPDAGTGRGGIAPVTEAFSDLALGALRGGQISLGDVANVGATEFGLNPTAAQFAGTLGSAQERGLPDFQFPGVPQQALGQPRPVAPTGQAGAGITVGEEPLRPAVAPSAIPPPVVQPAAQPAGFPDFRGSKPLNEGELLRSVGFAEPGLQFLNTGGTSPVGRMAMVGEGASGDAQDREMIFDLPDPGGVVVFNPEQTKVIEQLMGGRDLPGFQQGGIFQPRQEFIDQARSLREQAPISPGFNTQQADFFTRKPSFQQFNIRGLSTRTGAQEADIQQELRKFALEGFNRGQLAIGA